MMNRFQDILLALLVVGIAVQIWIGGGRIPAGGGRSGFMVPLAVGDTVSGLTGYNEAGTPVTIPLLTDEEAQITVIYSFHPDCSHSRSWGRAWARHFDQVQAEDSAVRRIALTLDGPLSGQDFAQRFGWETELLSLTGLSPLQREYSLVSRTPWVFVFDSHGVLRFDGHGSQLEQVEAAVSRLQSGRGYARRKRGFPAPTSTLSDSRYTQVAVLQCDRHPPASGAFHPNPTERKT